jgi:hypothetical protein
MVCTEGFKVNKGVISIELDFTGDICSRDYVSDLEELLFFSTLENLAGEGLTELFLDLGDFSHGRLKIDY